MKSISVGNPYICAFKKLVEILLINRITNCLLLYQKWVKPMVFARKKAFHFLSEASNWKKSSKS